MPWLHQSTQWCTVGDGGREQAEILIARGLKANVLPRAVGGRRTTANAYRTAYEYTDMVSPMYRPHEWKSTGSSSPRKSLICKYGMKSHQQYSF